jgi:signal transduction histidine kinase
MTGSRLLPLVFENLLRNAAVYAGPQPEVIIKTSKHDDMIEIRVTDNGPGINPSIEENLFKKGVSTTGGGMGLYLSKHICEACGGTITVSPSKKSGATFIVLLPIHKN